MNKFSTITLCLVFSATSTLAGDAITYAVDDQSYEDVLFGLEKRNH